MLTRQEIKACLAGKYSSQMPAWLFWFDSKFVEDNRYEVEKMQKQYEDDFVFCNAEIRKRAQESSLEPGESADAWGCLRAGLPEGAGTHPTRAIVTNVEEWERYVADGLPELSPVGYTNNVSIVLKKKPECYTVAQLWGTFFERMFLLIGYERLMLEIATGGELFSRMVPVLEDFTLCGINAAADAGAAAVFLADDWGTQHSLMISPDSWEKLFKPSYRTMIDVAHSRGLDVWFHSCGNITALISHWIDLGLDVISPLQPTAMDLSAIARIYLGQITFFGGLDVGYNIIRGTRDSIREEVRQLIKIFRAHEGRFMASPCNSIMPETPVENVWTLFEAVREFGRF